MSYLALSQVFVLLGPDVFVSLVVKHIFLDPGTLDCQCLFPAPGFLSRGFPVGVVMVLCLCLPLDHLGLPQGPLRVDPMSSSISSVWSRGL